MFLNNKNVQTALESLRISTAINSMRDDCMKVVFFNVLLVCFQDTFFSLKLLAEELIPVNMNFEMQLTVLFEQQDFEN